MVWSTVATDRYINDMCTWNSPGTLTINTCANAVPEVTFTYDLLAKQLNKIKEEEKMKNVKPIITHIEVVKPEKVMIVTIQMGHKETGDVCWTYVGKPTQVKVVVKEPDVFDMRRGCFIALAKYLYGDTWTLEGVEYQAEQLMMQKEYVKIVDSAIKKHNAYIREQEKLDKIMAENKAVAQRRREKNAKKKAENAKKVKLEAEMWREVSKKLFDHLTQDATQDDNK